MTLWGGRFSQELDAAAWELNASLNIDRRLALQDVCGSLAWADAIHQAGVLTDEEHQRITLGLQAIRNEFTSGFFDFEHRDEDIHTAVERRLGEIAGPVAGKLHTGRSRNDQVATDLRLWILQTLPQINAAIAELQGALVAQAEAAKETLMPGYTHLQRAQPILLAHWWLSHFWPLQRDRERLAQLAGRAAVLPLGSGALAGTPVKVDRNALTHTLGFVSASPNSIDAVSDRDFAAEFLFDAALTGIHLSKLAENIVLFTSAEFGFFELSDSFSTGSSLMPQKKNPDVFELTRGKAGVLIGQLTSLLATLKSLPSTYDKDLQEDKVPVFTATDVLEAVLPVLTNAINTIGVRPQRMRACIDASMMATDLADYLVSKGIPFRETHGIAGKAVRQAADQGVSLDKMPIEAYQAICPAFESDVYSVFDPLESVKRRSVQGGTAPEAVKAQIAQAKAVQAVGHYHMVQPRCGNA
jgi:argininosuccinate lyase